MIKIMRRLTLLIILVCCCLLEGCGYAYYRRLPLDYSPIQDSDSFGYILLSGALSGYYGNWGMRPDLLLYGMSSDGTKIKGGANLIDGKELITRERIRAHFLYKEIPENFILGELNIIKLPVGEYHFHRFWDLLRVSGKKRIFGGCRLISEDSYQNVTSSNPSYFKVKPQKIIYLGNIHIENTGTFVEQFTTFFVITHKIYKHFWRYSTKDNSDRDIKLFRESYKNFEGLEIEKNILNINGFCNLGKTPGYH